jgi:hypothetical protein
MLAVLARLHFHGKRRRAEALAPRRKPLGLIRAIGPLVVAGHEDDGMADARELPLSRLEPVVAAGKARGADVAEVHDEAERLGIEIVDQAPEPLDFSLGVGRVTEQRKGVAVRRRRMRARHQEPPQKQGQTPFFISRTLS